MRVLFDTLGCGYGGVAVYVENLTRGWQRRYPADTVHLLRGGNDPAPPNADVVDHQVDVPRPDVLTRPVVETVAVRRLVRSVAPDAVLAVRPSTPLLHPGVALGVVVHDLRHELLPAQFTRGRRAIRRVGYGHAYRLADGLVHISDRTRTDFEQLHPGYRDKPAVVVHHGADHVATWTPAGTDPVVLAFGHHTNKNVDLVIETWRVLAAEGGGAAATDELPRLTVVGLSGAARDDAAARVRAAGLDSSVTLAPYLPDPEFQALMAGAALVLFPSDFEGFGLPVLESMRLGVPVVVGPDRAVAEISGGHAVTLPAINPAELARGVRAGLASTDAQLRAARDHAESFTWARTAEQTRAFLLRLAAARS